MQESTTVRASVPADLWARVRAEALLRRLTVPQVIVEALRLWLAAPPPPPEGSA